MHWQMNSSPLEPLEHLWELNFFLNLLSNIPDHHSLGSPQLKDRDASGCWDKLLSSFIIHLSLKSSPTDSFVSLKSIASQNLSPIRKGIIPHAEVENSSQDLKEWYQCSSNFRKWQDLECWRQLYCLWIRLCLFISTFIIAHWDISITYCRMSTWIHHQRNENCCFQVYITGGMITIFIINKCLIRDVKCNNCDLKTGQVITQGCRRGPDIPKWNHH